MCTGVSAERLARFLRMMAHTENGNGMEKIDSNSQAMH